MIRFADKMLVNILFIVLVRYSVLPSFGASAEEECFIGDHKRGVCRVNSNCPQSSKRELQPDACLFQGDEAYVCCELLESELTYDSPEKDAHHRVEDEDEEKTAGLRQEGLPYKGEDDEDEETFRFYNSNSRQNHWNRERATEFYSKIQGGKHGNYIRGKGRGGDSSLHFISKRPVWSQSGETSNIFNAEDHRNTFNTGYQNHKTQGNTQFYEWNQPIPHRPQFVNNGNGNRRRQENQNYYGNYDYRRTTEQPRTTTSRVVLPADFRPNPRPDFNRPQNFNSGGKRPQNSFLNENRPGNSFPSDGWPNNQFSGNTRPHNFNSGGNKPQNQFSIRKRISEIKCEEYSEAVAVKVSGLPLTTDPKPVTINVEKCISAQQLIVGGENTTVGEFPHMAAIGFQDKNSRGIGWYCGGSLISDQFVLTAAHCTISPSRKPVRVRLGEYNLKKNNDGAYPEDYSIAEIINHPDYKVPSKYNDISLLKLSRRVEIRKHIRPACLQTNNNLHESKVIAIGWGRVANDEDTSEVLLKVALNVIEKNTCNRAYQNALRNDTLPHGIIDTQMCAGELSGGKDTCRGDSGGPIEIVSQTNRCIHYIVGVTSFGKACGAAYSPGVYTRVSAYIPWIESIVWPQ